MQKFSYSNKLRECKSYVLNKHRKEKMRFRSRRNKLSRREIIKSVNKDFKNSFHSINRPKKHLDLRFKGGI